MCRPATTHGVANGLCQAGLAEGAPTVGSMPHRSKNWADRSLSVVWADRSLSVVVHHERASERARLIHRPDASMISVLRLPARGSPLRVLRGRLSSIAAASSFLRGLQLSRPVPSPRSGLLVASHPFLCRMCAKDNQTHIVLSFLPRSIYP